MNATIHRTPSPDPAQREVLRRLWNDVYPLALAYETPEALRAYLDALAAPMHYLHYDEQGAIAAWSFTFLREERIWFGILVQETAQGQGFGRRLMAAMRLESTALNGWVVTDNNALKANGCVYLSPMGFYERLGFARDEQRLINISGLRLMQVSRNEHPGHQYRVRPFAVSDAADYRAMRLEALQVAPGVFGNSYSTEAAFPDEQWPDRLANPAIGTFGLYDGCELIGITSVVTNTGQPDEGYMSQSYIRPAHRGKGLSRLLYEIRLAFARQRQIRRLIIGHRESNIVSRAANQRFGFRYTHRETRLWPDGGTEDMLYYTLELS